MKRFRFSLQPLAVVRAHREQQAKAIFASAVQAHAKTEEDLVRTRSRIAAFEAALNAGRQQAFSAATAAEALHAYRAERGLEKDAERTVQVARETMEQRRVDYIAAHRNLEVVHRLETKARTLHRAENARAEQSEFDDFSSRRAMRPSPFKP